MNKKIATIPFIFFLFLTAPFSSAMALHEKILLTSIPKCGTNLMIKLLYDLTHKRYDTNSDNFLALHPNAYGKFGKEKFLVTHAIASDSNRKTVKKCGFKAIFIYRDPRDQVVSLAYYIKSLPGSWPLLAHMSVEELITNLIADISIMKNDQLWKMGEMDSFFGIDTFYSSYLGWIGDPLVYTTTFERLVGPKGGGNEEAQIGEIVNIGSHLSCSLTYGEAKMIANRLFGGTDTFRVGKIGSWKKQFTEEQKALFKEVAGKLLIDLGYEKDFNW